MYFSGEIAGPRSELEPLAGYFAQISKQFGECFHDIFDEDILEADARGVQRVG